MKNFKRNKKTIHYIAATAIGEHYNHAKKIRNSMIISFLGGTFGQFMLGYTDSKETRGIKIGIGIVFLSALVKDIINNFKIAKEMNQFDEIYNIIKRPIFENEMITVDYINEKETKEAKVIFSDNSYIFENIKDNEYQCTYTDISGETIDITEPVKKVFMKKK